MESLFANSSLSPIGVGTWQLGLRGWGNDYNEVSATDALGLALKSGINFIDTAEIYGSGRSEELIGKVINPEIRGRVFIATKIAGFNASSRNVKRRIDGSLKRLNTDYIDLYQVHWEPSIYTDLGELFKELERALADGKIKYIGVSNFSLSVLKKVSNYLKDTSIESNQIKFNMIERPSAELMNFMRERNIKLIAWSPLGQGFLTGKYGTNKKPLGYTRKINRLFSDNSAKRWEPLLQTLKQISEMKKIPVVQLVLAYERELGVYLIPGFKNAKQVTDIASSMSVSLSKEDIYEITRVCDQIGTIPTRETMSPRIIPNFLVKLMSSFV